jgi:hypothetical protein
LPWISKKARPLMADRAFNRLAHKNADRGAGPGIGAQFVSFNFTNRVICAPASTLKMQAPVVGFLSAHLRGFGRERDATERLGKGAVLAVMKLSPGGRLVAGKPRVHKNAWLRSRRHCKQQCEIAVSGLK